MDFNLLEEKWIPVLWTDRSFERVGVRKALTQAGRIRQIAAANPTKTVVYVKKDE